MELENQKQNIGYLMTTKKYKLSFFGTSPRHDWAAIFLFGLALITTFSLLYYFDTLSIKSSISEDNLVREQKHYFNIEKAEKLLKDFEGRRGLVDQSL